MCIRDRAKLERLLAAIGDATLVHSDARMADAEGRQVAPHLWSERHIDQSDFASLLFANTVAGSASVFRTSLLETILPFPDGPGLLFHDHWIGMAALATGSIAYVDEPLYDYTQHAGAVTGGGEPEPDGFARSPSAALRRLDSWRSSYFRVYVQLKIQAMTLLARSPGRLAPGRRKTLQRVVAAESSWAATAWFAARLLRAAIGRDQTLGAESLSVRGLLWKRLVGLGSHVPARFWPKSLGTALEPLDLDRTSTRRARRWRARRRGQAK